jgi:predicted transcriptional regulator
MATPLAIDWNQAKILRAKGLSYAKIAQELGCSLGAVSSRAHRENWNESARKAEDILQNHAVARAGDRFGELAEAWVQEMVQDIQDSTSAIRKIKPGSNLRQLGEREQVMERLVKRGRLMFGLDQETKSTVQIAFFQSPIKPDAQPIDAEVITPSPPPDPPL